MEDQEFIRRFEDCTLPNGSFRHREHVRVVWLYLHYYPLIETLSRFSVGLRRFAASHGKPNLYHETITCAYVLLINERLARHHSAETWDEFVAANEDLFDWKNNVLRLYYTEETLRSDFARSTFVFPNKIAT